jgi:hypothetical protein
MTVALDLLLDFDVSRFIVIAARGQTTGVRRQSTSGQRKMTNDSLQKRDLERSDDEGESLQEELRRENQLVRSTGMISKPAMALAFGVVFLLVAVIFAAPSGQWFWTCLLGGVGTISVAWAIFAWRRRNRV